MILVVEKVDNFNYTFLDNNHKIIDLKLEIQDYDLQIGDKLMIDERLFNDIKNSLTVFGNITDKTGRNILNINNDNLLLEVIQVERNGKKTYLKRLYG